MKKTKETKSRLDISIKYKYVNVKNSCLKIWKILNCFSNVYLSITRIFLFSNTVIIKQNKHLIKKGQSGEG